MHRYGEEGRRLSRLACGIDEREVNATRETKSVSSETTFERDIADLRTLERILWGLAEELSARLKDKELSGATVTRKSSTACFGERGPAIDEVGRISFRRCGERAHSDSEQTKLRAVGFAFEKNARRGKDTTSQLRWGFQRLGSRADFKVRRLQLQRRALAMASWSAASLSILRPKRSASETRAHHGP